MLRQLFFFIFVFWGVNQTLAETSENAESQKNKIENLQPTMAPNSKFLNPHVDDATNLQLAVAAFSDDAVKPDTKGEFKEILPNLSKVFLDEGVKKLGGGAGLINFKWLPFFQGIFSGNKNYGFKTA